MGIDRAVFAREMTLLAERFNRSDLSAQLRQRYFDFLDARMGSAQFEASARTIFNADTFWPAPARFLEALGLDPSSEAEEAWQLALREASSGLARPLSEYDPAHAAALLEVGKNRAIGLTSEKQLPWVKREFIAAFKAHRELAQVEALGEGRKAREEA